MNSADLERIGVLRAMDPVALARLAAGRGFLVPALREREGRLVSDPATEQPFSAHSPMGFETCPILLMPVALGDEPLGLITLGGHPPGQFDLNDLNLPRGVARQTAQAILDARHREDDEARARHAKRYVRF